MNKNLLVVRYVILCALAGLTGCADHSGVQAKVDIHHETRGFDSWRHARYGLRTGGDVHHGTVVQHPGNHRLDVDTESDQGYVVQGEAPPENGPSQAALVEPLISGPREWPLNVFTGVPFHPDPTADISVKVSPDPDHRGDESKLITTIVIHGQKAKYAHQEH